jgi:hypothetical protein
MRNRTIRGVVASLIVLVVGVGVASCTPSGTDKDAEATAYLKEAKLNMILEQREDIAMGYLLSKGIQLGDIQVQRNPCFSEATNGTVQGWKSRNGLEGGSFPAGTPITLFVEDCSVAPGSGAASGSGSDTYVWYPAGYSPVNQNPSFAIQWVPGAADPCGNISCSYWTMNIVSQNDCPGGVYVEVNMSDSGGTVFDWDNDTVASLAAGQVAQLQFLTYEPRDGDNTAQVANVSCN